MKNRKRTSDVWFLDCLSHTWHGVPSMKMARASASVSLVDGKIHVFGGVEDCPNWADSKEVFDPNTQTWESWLPYYVETKTYALDIQQSVVLDDNGQSFYIVPSDSISLGETDSKQPGHRKDWCVIGKELYCRGTRGRILWCDPRNLEWKRVKGWEELDYLFWCWVHRWGKPARPVEFDIGKLCSNSAGTLSYSETSSLTILRGMWSFGVLRFMWRDAREERFGGSVSGLMLSSNFILISHTHIPLRSYMPASVYV
ncbi:unnamed protein product [Brassica rapa subsp. narinosa]